MNLSNAWMLHFLWVLPLIVFVLIVHHRKRQQAMERFAEQPLLNRLTIMDHKGTRFVKTLMLLSAFVALIIALAGPRWGSRYQDVSRKGVDIIVLMDVSRSMLVEDVKPNRLERATREIIDFLKVVEGDRVGLVAFSGTAFVQCPLTLDYAAMEMFLNVLEPGVIPVLGTDLGAALDAGIRAFDVKAETDKVMLLITDGEDNENRGLKAAQKAADHDVKIFVFGIGDPSGGPIPAGNDQGGFIKDSSGNLVLSKLNEEALRDIAIVTGGGYVRSVAGDLDLDMLYFDGIKQKTEAHTLKSGKIKVYEERFNIFILAAFLLLLIEEMLDDKRRPVPKKRVVFFSLLLALVFFLWLSPNPTLATESPDELYRQGRYAEAVKAYAQKDMDYPKDIRFRYNRGCAAFQDGQYDEAIAAFSSVLRRSQNDQDARFKAVFNLGNTAFKQGNFALAIEYFKQALVEQPEDEDARYNLELSLKAQQKEQEKKKQEQADQSNTPPQGNLPQNQERADSRNQGEPSPDKDSQNSGGEKEDPQEDEGNQDDEESSSGNEDQKQARRNSEQEPSPNKTPESKDEDNLSGDLKPLEEMPGLEQGSTSQPETPPNIDEKKAKALLDNVKENPSQIIRFMMSEQDRQGAFSGRDW